MNYRSPGVTIVEALVAVIIVGIVATAGGPVFLRTLEIAKGSEAETTLRAIFQAERAYAFDQTPNHFGTLADLENGRYLPGNLNTIEWTYTLTLAGSPAVTYTATATRQRGPYSEPPNNIRQMKETGVLTPSSWPP